MPFLSRQIQICACTETTIVENITNQTMIVFAGYFSNIGKVQTGLNLVLYNGSVRTSLLHNVPMPLHASLIIEKQVLLPGAALKAFLEDPVTTVDCSLSIMTVRGDMGPIPGAGDPAAPNPGASMPVQIIDPLVWNSQDQNY